jgi:Na+/H+ antiporter NhaC
VSRTGDRDHATQTVTGCLYAAHGLYTIIAGIALALFCWLIPMLLVKVTSSDVVDAERLSPTARWVLDNRELMPLMAIPVVVLGVVALNKVPLRLLWTILGVLALLVPAALLIYTFVVAIALLYNPPPL